MDSPVQWQRSRSPIDGFEPMAPGEARAAHGSGPLRTPEILVLLGRPLLRVLRRRLVQVLSEHLGPA